MHENIIFSIVLPHVPFSGSQVVRRVGLSHEGGSFMTPLGQGT